jgi:hypothetical protein
MVSIRPFAEGDNARLLDIEKLCPQGNEKYAMGVDKSDIIARYELYDNLINDYYTGRAHFVPYTPESFESYVKGIPAYGLENFLVVKDEGKVVACAGLWDCSVLGDMCYTKEPLIWKVMRGVFGFLSLFGKMPWIPAEGEYFKGYYVTDHAFKPQIDTWHVFAKAFEGELLELSPLYIDIRDCIL